jgi:hypothetical protein
MKNWTILGTSGNAKFLLDGQEVTANDFAQFLRDLGNNLREKELQVDEYHRFCEEIVKSTETDLIFWRRRAQFSLDTMIKRVDEFCNVCDSRKPCQLSHD